MKPRVKMHDMPGDVPKREKISMLEGRHKGKRRAKSFKKLVRMKEKATLRRRAAREIAEELHDQEADGRPHDA